MDREAQRLSTRLKKHRCQAPGGDLAYPIKPRFRIRRSTCILPGAQLLLGARERQGRAKHLVVDLRSLSS